MSDAPAIFEFGDFVLDERRRELRRDGAPLLLQAKPVALLGYLVRHRDRAVPKQELFDAVWPDAIVSDASLSSALRDVRRALGDTGSLQAFVRTERGRGFRFVAPVNERPASSLAVAVLPFLDLSPSGDQGHLADGLAEELIRSLSQAPDLQVAARTSSFAFRGEGRDVREVGQVLGVGRVVEGSLQRDGDRLRVTVQLVRTTDGLHDWSETFERNLEGIFAAQQDIVRAITDALRSKLGSAWSERAPVDTRARELHLVGQRLAKVPAEDALHDAIRYLEQALALEPGFALAQAELGIAHYDLWDSGFDATAARLERAREHAERALGLDSDLPEALSIFALIESNSYRWAEAERAVNRALEINPSSVDALQVRSALHCEAGRVEDALADGQRVLALDPLSPIMNRWVGKVHYFARDYGRAIELGRRARELGAGATDWHATVLSHLAKERPEQALEETIRFVPPEAEPAIRAGYARAGVRGVVEDVLRLGAALSGQPYGPFPESAAVWLAYLGDPERMFEAMELGYQAGRMWFIQADPVYDPYRSDPRFRDLLARMGLSD